MSSKKILGITLIIIGLVAFFAGNYISDRVGEGKEQISSAQKKVDTGRGLFSLTPETKTIGKGLTDSAQKKIDAGKELVGKYAQLASLLNTGGIILTLAGVGILLIGRKKR